MNDEAEKVFKLILKATLRLSEGYEEAMTELYDAVYLWDQLDLPMIESREYTELACAFHDAIATHGTGFLRAHARLRVAQEDVRAYLEGAA